MKQVKITAISGQSLITSDGNVIYPIGNRIFSVGDYAWTDGTVAFGHETGGGGIVPTSMDNIPILVYIKGVYQFGTIKHMSYQAEEDYKSELLYRSLFVNDENTAFYIKAVGNDAKQFVKENAIYNLMTGKKIFNSTGVIVTVKITKDGDLMTILWNNDFGSTPDLYVVSPGDPPPNLISEADLKLYKNENDIFDFKAAIRNIYDIIDAEIAKSDRYTVSLLTRNAVINDDSGNCTVCIGSTTVIQGSNTNTWVYEYWEINLSADFAFTITRLGQNMKIRLNDGYYYTGSNVYPNTDALEIYNKDDKNIANIDPLVEVMGYVAGSNFDIACIGKTNASLINIRPSWQWMSYGGTDNNAILQTAENGQETVLKPDYCFNESFVKMKDGKINTIKKNLGKIFKGDD